VHRTIAAEPHAEKGLGDVRQQGADLTRSHFDLQQDGSLQGITVGRPALHQGGPFPEHPAHLQGLELKTLGTPDEFPTERGFTPILESIVIVVVAHEEMMLDPFRAKHGWAQRIGLCVHAPNHVLPTTTRAASYSWAH
jgi:hypothetical protein